jgi:hypothetical protein
MAKSWRCFHCDEVLTTRESAAEHFGDGDYEYEPPLCVEAATTDKRKLVLDNRAIWKDLQEAHAEVEELTGRLGGLQQIVSKATGKTDATSHDLHLALQRAEESGYAKGLQDARDAREAA